MKALKILTQGIVQGVGFRPYVYRLASELKLNGYVRNLGNVVEIIVEGDNSDLFVDRLPKELPPIAKISSMEVEEIEEKDYDDLIFIIRKYIENSEDDLIITKLSHERYEKILDDLDDESLIFDYNRRAQILIIRKEHRNINPIAKIGIITAGTSDINVAEEARVIVEEGGCEAITSYDIGVAGIHRLFPQIAHMVKEGVQAFIVCAGMEGALPSVVAGLVDVPVIGVPTSVGYGVGEGGRVALDAMLQSCAPGIAVVNIDNGFGAGVFALTIVKSV